MKKILVLFVMLQSLILLVNASPLSANKIYEENADSVFFLETQDAAGSGIVLKEDGTFVTCFHVIANADYINVKTKDGRTYKVSGYKYINPQTDVAILTIKTPKKFAPVSVADSKSIKVGDNVYAIANPQSLKFVLSNGMVNQISKEYIQFSAPASPGSSGGALFNQEGQLIGMITSQFNPSSAQNINFALPVSYFLPYADKKKKVNTKGLIWTEFLTSVAKEKDLKAYLNYAFKLKDLSLAYKYMRGSDYLENLKSDDYAFCGIMALSSFMDNVGNTLLLSDASKWFALSITSNKNLELSYYGLVTSLFLNPYIANEEVKEFAAPLKRYSKSSKVFYNYAHKLLECSVEDEKCYQESLSGFSAHLVELTKQVYIKN